MGSKMVNGFGRITLTNLPKKVYIKLNKSAIGYVINLVEKSNPLLDEKTRENLYRMKNSKKISLDFLEKISNLLAIEKDYFEENIILITSDKSTDIGIKNPRIPFKFNSVEGARFISAIMGDGEINSQIQVRYNNQNKSLVYLILRSAKKIFGGVDYKIYYRKDKTYQLHFPKIVGLIVRNFGLKPGYKSETNYGIPSFIFNLHKNLKSIFIKQFFNDEGNVRLKDRRLQIKQTITINVSKEYCKLNPKRYCPKSLLDLQRLLLDFNISSKLSLGHYRNNKSDWELSIYRKENLKNFQKDIGFDLVYKNKLLNKAIKSYKFPSASRNGRLDFALEKCKSVQKKYGYITKNLLAKESERALKTATYYLVDLKRRGFLTEIEKPRTKSGIPLPVKYTLTNIVV